MQTRRIIGLLAVVLASGSVQALETHGDEVLDVDYDAGTAFLWDSSRINLIGQGELQSANAHDASTLTLADTARISMAAKLYDSSRMTISSGYVNQILAHQDSSLHDVNQSTVAMSGGTVNSLSVDVNAFGPVVERVSITGGTVKDLLPVLHLQNAEHFDFAGLSLSDMPAYGIIAAPGTVQLLRPGFYTTGTSSLAVSDGYLYYANALDSSSVALTGGTAESIDTWGSSHLSISGGSVDSVWCTTEMTLSGGDIEIVVLDHGSEMAMSGGTVARWVYLEGAHMELSGGSVDLIEAMGYQPDIDDSVVPSEVTLRGGSVKSFTAVDSTVRLVAVGVVPSEGLTLAGSRVLGTGLLSGRWLDGTAWDIDIVSNHASAEILIEAPQPGDANNDGFVGVQDLGILAFNWGQSGRYWSTGDFTGNDVVNVGDLGVLAYNWGWVHPASPGAMAGTGSTTIPEPLTILALALGGLAVLRHRRK